MKNNAWMCFWIDEQANSYMDPFIYVFINSFMYSFIHHYNLFNFLLHLLRAVIHLLRNLCLEPWLFADTALKKPFSMIHAFRNIYCYELFAFRIRLVRNNISKGWKTEHCIFPQIIPVPRNAQKHISDAPQIMFLIFVKPYGPRALWPPGPMAPGHYGPRALWPPGHMAPGPYGPWALCLYIYIYIYIVYIYMFIYLFFFFFFYFYNLGIYIFIYIYIYIYITRVSLLHV